MLQKRAALLSIALSLSLLSCGRIPSEALQISERCSTDRSACLTQEILKITKEDPQKLIGLFADFSSLLKDGTLTDDPRIFSPLIHEVGMELAFNKVPTQEAFALCPLNFKAGCLHGVVMEYVDELPTVDPTFCDFAQSDDLLYRNCVHGLGHELAAKSLGDLNSILSLCPFTDPRVNRACLTGVMMEYSTGVSGTGTHTHEPPPGSILLPCTELDPIYQNTCAIALGAYRQYSPDIEPFATTAETCSSLPTELQSACFLGLAEKVFTAAAEDLTQADQICSTFPSAALQLCQDSVLTIKKLESVL